MFHVLFQLFSVKRCYHLAFCNRLILNPLTKKQSINQFLLFYLICLIVLSCFYLSQWSCAQGVGWNWSTRRNPLGTGCFPSCGLDLCLLLRVERSQISWKGKYHPHVWSKSSSVRLLKASTLKVIKKYIVCITVCFTVSIFLTSCGICNP